MTLKGNGSHTVHQADGRDTSRQAHSAHTTYVNNAPTAHATKLSGHGFSLDGYKGMAIVGKKQMGGLCYRIIINERLLVWQCVRRHGSAIRGGFSVNVVHFDGVNVHEDLMRRLHRLTFVFLSNSAETQVNCCAHLCLYVDISSETLVDLDLRCVRGVCAIHVVAVAPSFAGV